MTEFAPDSGAIVDYARSLLPTDLYQLNMVEAYLASGMTGTAVFEFFVRRMPSTRSFLMAAGLEQTVRYLLDGRVSTEEADWLRATGRFSDRLIDFLAGFRFSGDVDAVPEGTPVFSDEPIIRVTAPIAEAQLVETRLINFVHYQTLVATKAARMVRAAGGRTLIDFGLRRAHSAEAGVLAARAAYIAGFAGTATIPAARMFGVPLHGTMAHSFVQAHDDEKAAFLAFARARPDQTVFLIDTYDTERGAWTVVDLAPVLEREGITVGGVRLDSGDLAEHAGKVRGILDDNGLSGVRIVASGGIDEYELEALTAVSAPIDAYGVGTSLVTSDDQPALDCAYKIKSYAGVPQRKRSERKAYWPGATQVHRCLDTSGRIAGDFLTAADEPSPDDTTPLLRPVVRSGRLVGPLPDLERVRTHAAAELALLPEDVGCLHGARTVAVDVSQHLRDLADRVDRRVEERARR